MSKAGAKKKPVSLRKRKSRGVKKIANAKPRTIERVNSDVSSLGYEAMEMPTTTLGTLLPRLSLKNPVVSDSEDSSHVSDLSSKSSSDEFIPSTKDHDVLNKVEGDMDKDVACTTSRKLKRKRLRLNPGDSNRGSSLVYSVLSGNDALDRASKTRRRNSEPPPLPGLDTSVQHDSTRRATVSSLPGEREISTTLSFDSTSSSVSISSSVGGRLSSKRSSLSTGESLEVNSFVIVESGTYKGRRAMVKKLLANQVLVLLPTFSFQVERWIDRSSLRPLTDSELLNQLNSNLQGSDSDLEPLSVWDETSSYENVNFVQDTFKGFCNEQEPQDDSVCGSVNGGNSTKQTNMSPFDLNATLDVVTNIIDNVAETCKVAKSGGLTGVEERLARLQQSWRTYVNEKDGSRCSTPSLNETSPSFYNISDKSGCSTPSHLRYCPEANILHTPSDFLNCDPDEALGTLSPGGVTFELPGLDNEGNETAADAAFQTDSEDLLADLDDATDAFDDFFNSQNVQELRSHTPTVDWSKMQAVAI